MWVVRLAHPTLNRFRLIAEKTRETAELEASIQEKVRQAELMETVRSFNPKASKLLLSPEHRLCELAEQLTVQVHQEQIDLGSLLRLSSLAEHPAMWGTIPSPRLQKQELIPDETNRESYMPHPILNEGATKGILVTRADYGPDAYEFAKGKPITLLSSGELLYLLQRHGHKARIDLAEARLLASEKEKRNTEPLE